MKRIVFVKLGGSLITDKNVPFKLRKARLSLSVGQIATAMKRDKELQIVMGNGAGSFGHYVAKRYGVADGMNTDKKREGFCRVNEGVAALNDIVVSECIRHAIPAVSLQPSAFMTSRNGRVHTLFLEPFEGFFRTRLVPVVYGDIVYDTEKGCHIFSTEMIFSELCIRLKPKYHVPFQIIHCGTTAGVVDQNGVTISSIRRTDIKRIGNYLHATSGYDVTGGMGHKVKEALRVAHFGIKSLIINGGEKDALLHALLGKPVQGTVVGQ